MDRQSSKEKLLDALNSDDLQIRAAAEAVLGVCKYPDGYWVMPDYYYPGINYKPSKSLLRDGDTGKAKARLDETSNGKIITSQLFSPLSEREYKKCKPREGLDSLYNINIREDEMIEVKNEKGETVEIPWVVFCGIFLKCRELGYSRPNALDNAGPKDIETKEKWMKNQEKIIELQETID